VIRFVRGDIFETGAEALVNPVNTVGVSGAGLAKQFKRRFPSAVSQYARLCAERAFRIGHALTIMDNGVLVCFVPTKIHWSGKSEVKWVDAGLKSLRQALDAMGVNSVAIPALGCGLGGLDFEQDVKPLIEKHFGDSNMDVIVVERYQEQKARG